MARAGTNEATHAGTMPPHIRKTHAVLAIGLALSAASSAALAQNTSENFSAFSDGALIPPALGDQTQHETFHVDDGSIASYVQRAVDDYCAAWPSPNKCQLTSTARRTIHGSTPGSAFAQLDVTVDVTLDDEPVEKHVSNFGIVLVQSCPDDALLVTEQGGLVENRADTSGKVPVACASPDALPKGASLGPPQETGANYCPIGNATTVGNPINPLTFSKIETVIDYVGPKASGLMFGRTYHSGVFSIDDRFSKFGRYPAGARVGARWRHSWDRAFVRRPYFDKNGFVYATALYLVGEDGGETRFIKKGDIFIPTEGKRGVLREHPDNGWVYTWPDLTVEHYDDQGRLRTRTDPNGNVVALHYDEIEVGIGFKTKVLSSISDRQGRELILKYDRLGRLETVDQPDGGRIKYGYSGDILEGLDANLVKVTYPGGRSAHYLYDEPANGGAPNHKLTGIVGGDGKRFASFFYSGNRAIRSVHGDNSEETAISITGGAISLYEGDRSHGQLWTPRYDKGVIRLGDRTETFREDSVTRSFEYLGGGLVSAQTDYLGVPTTYRYDHDRQLEIERTEADGTAVSRTIRTSWHPRFDKPTRIDDGAHWMTINYDDRGNVLERREGGLADASDPASPPWPTDRSTHYAYDTAGRLTSVDGPQAGTDDTTHLAYRTSDDAGCASGPASCSWRAGDLHTVTNPLGHVTTILAYDGAGRVVVSTDPNGVRTERQYDAEGRPIEVIVRARRNGSPSPHDAITKVSYNANGAVETVTDPDGATLGHIYNDAHRLIEQADAVGNRRVMLRESRGLLAGDRYYRKDDTLDVTRDYEYDEHGVLTFDRPKDMAWKYYDYDGNGRYAGRHGSDLYKEAIERDPLGRPSSITIGRDASAQTTHLTYDSIDRVKDVVDPNGLSTAYLRNGLGDLLWQRSPDSGDSEFENDADGRPISETPADGRKIERDFDATGRVTRLSYSDGTETVYRYDVEAPGCPAEANFAVGHLSTVTDRDGSVSFCYDFAGRVTQKTQTTRGVRLVLGYSYTPAGRLAAITYPDGRTVTYTRDAAGRVTAIDTQDVTGAATPVLTNVQHDAPGHVIGWTAGLRTVKRLYNAGGYLSQLDDGRDGLKTSLRYYADNYIYEIGSGLAALTVEADTTTRITMTATSEMTPEHPFGMIQNYTYDATGNRLSWSSNFMTNRKFEYAADSHRLLVANKVNREYDANGNTTRIGEREFVYDARGRMSQVKVNGVAEMNYAYGPFGQQVARYIAGGTTVSLHDEAGHWLGDYDGSGKPVKQVVWFDDLPIAAIDGDAIHDIQSDHLGTPRVVVDRATDKVVWKWPLTNEAFGAEAPNEDPDKDGNKYVLDMRFPGQRYDAATGLFQNGWRDYDPTSGRYVQSDPTGLAGGISTYVYALNRPLTLTDSQGLLATSEADMSINPIASVFLADFAFIQNYRAMRDANTIGADKYFHCKANCQAAKLGLGGVVEATIVSEIREYTDQVIKGDPRWACDQDRAANSLGRNGGRRDASTSCATTCSPLRPAGLDPRY